MNGSGEELKNETEITDITKTETGTDGSDAVKEEASDEKSRNYPTQAALIIRAIVGGYVAYLAYQIATSKSEVTPVMWAAVAIFTVAGVGLVAMSVKHFVCGEYEGGSRDA